MDTFNPIIDSTDSQTIIIYDDYLVICGNAPSSHCAAAILYVFESCINQNGNHSDKEHWIDKSHTELRDDMLGLYSQSTINKNLVWLIGVGFLKRRTAENKWDKKYRYRLDVDMLKLAIDGRHEFSDYHTVLPLDPPEPGYIYLLKSPTGHYKIGRTSNPSNRLKKFSIIMPFEVKFLHLIKTNDMRRLEQELHSRFAEKRTKGEWFLLTDDDVGSITTSEEVTYHLRESEYNDY